MINHLITQKNWQTQLSEAVTSVDELLSILKLDSLRDDIYVPKHFELRVPRSFVAKMRVGDKNDPLLKQVLPDKREQIKVTGYFQVLFAFSIHRIGSQRNNGRQIFGII